MNDPIRDQLLLEQIGSAESVEQLRDLRDRVQERMKALLPSSPVELVYGGLNEAHDAVIGRAIMLAETEMARLGKGSPPVPYAYLLFGSGGRREQTLASDQDSGLLYGDPIGEKGGESAGVYFQQLAAIIVEYLMRLGYPPCEGNVISTNPSWSGTLSEWKHRLDIWFEEANWETVRYLLIVADARIVYGDESLIQKLWDHYYSDMLNKPVIVRRMADNTVRHKVLIGVFGQLLKERYGAEAGSIDIKYGAYIPVVNAVRLMAIHTGLRESSTLGRLDKLAQAGRIGIEEAVLYRDAFLLFLKLRLMATENPEDGMHEKTGKLAKNMQTKVLTRELKRALRVGKTLQARVFRQTVGRLR
jgi:CBS domain-containing protein